MASYTVSQNCVASIDQQYNVYFAQILAANTALASYNFFLSNAPTTALTGVAAQPGSTTANLYTGLSATITGNTSPTVTLMSSLTVAASGSQAAFQVTATSAAPGLFLPVCNSPTHATLTASSVSTTPNCYSIGGANTLTVTWTPGVTLGANDFWQIAVSGSTGPDYNIANLNVNPSATSTGSLSTQIVIPPNSARPSLPPPSTSKNA